MAFRYEFIEAAAKDPYKLTRHTQPLLHSIAATHIPAILKNPYAAGEAKKGDLAGLRAYELTVRGVAYRLVYSVEGDVVRFVVIGPHDAAYQKASRR